MCIILFSPSNNLVREILLLTPLKTGELSLRAVEELAGPAQRGAGREHLLQEERAPTRSQTASRCLGRSENQSERGWSDRQYGTVVGGTEGVSRNSRRLVFVILLFKAQ